MSFVSSESQQQQQSVYTDPNRRGSDPGDSAVRKVVYNLYRGLLGNYNDRANDIISSLPAEQVCEDQGIGKQVESMMRQSAEIRGGTGEGLSASRSPSANMAALPAEGGGAPPPPPPPPPPPMPNGSSSMPSIKLNSELNGNNSRGNNGGGGKHMPGGGAPFSYIPPAAIQNAMMTKDKKPFTYTPGGIDFLSEIRSPRMQRRISKNAADEGVVHHQQQQNHPSAAGASAGPAQLSPQAMMAMQPQMAVPVFPPMPQQMPVLHSPTIPSPPQLHHYEPPTPPAPPPPPVTNMRAQLKPAVPNFNPAPHQQHQSHDAELQEVLNSFPAPVKQQNSAPVPAPAPFVERRNAQLGSIYIPPVTSSSSSTPSSVIASPAKTPMPWMNSQNRTPSSPTPPFVQQLQQERVVPMTMASVIDPGRFDDVKPSSSVRVIPIAVEGRSTAPTPRNARTEEVHPPWHSTPQKVIPIHLEATPVRNTTEAPWRTQAAANANQIASMMEELMMSPTATASSGGRQGGDPPAAATATLNRSISTVQSQQPGQPTQSRSFRILQMITDTVHDPAQEDQDGAGESGRLSRSSVGSNNSGGGGRQQQQPPPPGERRLNLTQEDRELMDMFRSQVNEEQSLHQESDPRYRGSHIPSRAFRILQNFTAESDDNHGQQHGAGAIPVNRQQVAPANHQAPAQQQRVRAPPSEQSEPEPRKYMGGNIPSRSFRMLQAMTASDPNDDDSTEMKNPTILIDNCEDQFLIDHLPVDQIVPDQESDLNNSDHSAMTNSVELKPSDQDADVDTESEATHHHSRLLRLLSSEAETLHSLPPHPQVPTAELEAAFQPLQPGVRLRIKSKRAKDRIPSRVFRSLQHEFDSSTEDIQQSSSSSSAAHPPASAFFRYSHLYASVTPETPSSATSELEGFFPPRLN